MHVKYETEQKEKRFFSYRIQNNCCFKYDLQKSMQARNLTFALAIVLIALQSLFIGYNRYRLKQRNRNQQLAIKQGEINIKNSNRLVIY